MKKLIIWTLISALPVVSILTPVSIYAASWDTTSSSSGQTSTSSTSTPVRDKVQEEMSCMKILAKYVKQDGRFNGEDISDALLNDKGDKRADLSNYKGPNWFLDNTRRAPDWSKFFKARRNNIGTIITASDYIMTQFVTFGTNSDFKFPLPTKDSSNPLGDDYGKFKDNIVYTHHLTNNGVFVSCGFLHIKPAANKTLSDVSPDNYMTNTIDASGFEMIKSPSDPEKNEFNDRYVVGKVNVPVQNWNNEHQFTMELITVAWDNGSPLFNEFETFPLQVRAMTDADNRTDVNAVQRKFLENVHEETCLQIPHGDINSLPTMCNKTFKSLTIQDPYLGSLQSAPTNNILSKISDFFFPQTFAALDITDPEYLKIKESTKNWWIPEWGMYVNEGLSYQSLRKIDALGNSLLKNYILRATDPQFEESVAAYQKKGEKLRPEDAVFLGCNIDYKTRVKLINTWLDSVNPTTFDINNITYPDPKMGDCILPYPDARHKNTVISWSYLTNQYNAAVASNNTTLVQELGKQVEIDKYNASTKLNEMKGMVGTPNSTIPLYVWAALLILWALTTIVVLKRKNTPPKNQ